MELIHNINAGRVAWCLADARASLEEAAAETGIALAKLEGLIEGRGGITFGQLRGLADYFGRSVLFFVDPAPIDAEQVHTPQYRTLAGQKPDLSRRVRQLVQRVERQRAVYRSLLEDVDEADRPRFEPPEMPNDPAEAAVVARRWLGLGDRNDFDSYRRSVESNGILVFRTNGYAGRWQIARESPVLGFALYDPVLPVIVVKRQAAETRQSFTLMHELGHVLLHRTSSVDDETDLRSTQGMERAANRFAAHVLVPDAALKAIADVGRPVDVAGLDEWLRPQRKTWGVSAEVILVRLVETGRLPQSVVDDYRAWWRVRPQVQAGDESGSRAYRFREPRHLFGDRYVRTVLGALSARRISLNKASDYLDGLKLSDLHKLERFCADA